MSQRANTVVVVGRDHAGRDSQEATIVALNRQVARLAYLTWEQRGRPLGQWSQLWLEAAAQLATAARPDPVAAVVPAAIAQRQHDTPTPLSPH